MGDVGEFWEAVRYGSNTSSKEIRRRHKAAAAQFETAKKVAAVGKVTMTRERKDHYRLTFENGAMYDVHAGIRRIHQIKGNRKFLKVENADDLGWLVAVAEAAAAIAAS